jgi:neutral amino acid transport system permease protein
VVEAIVQAIINGTIAGAIIAMGAVGLSLVYGVLRLVNFAHGELLTVGAYAAFMLNVVLGQPLWVGFVGAVVASAMLALATEGIIWRPLRRRRFGRLQLMLMSLGLSIFLRNAVIFIWGSEFKLLDADRNQAYFFFGLSISLLQIIAIFVAVVALVAVGLLLRATRVGKMMRAVASNAALSEVAGIDTRFVTTVTWLLAGGLSGLAGALTGMLNVVEPNMGFFLILLLFAAAILGGIGDAYGTLAGAFILGWIQSLATLVINPSYGITVAFVVMIGVLAVRPEGLFRRAATG